MSRNPIIPKPDSVFWTDDQWKAIAANGQDILVAAAAGSGKTAVLVERIIRKIIGSEQLDIDQLLVVTFTNASAQEMKHRIGEVLEREVNANPTSQHLRKQLALLNKASISTIHSFCLEVIKRYYYLIDLDPGFRIADETEIQLLRDECLEEIFEEEYGKNNNDDFFDVVDSFTNDRSDDALQTIIQELYDFSRANPSPDQYLMGILEMYEMNPETPMEQTKFANTLRLDVKLVLSGVKNLLNYGLDITRMPTGPAPRESNFLDDLKQLDILERANEDSWYTLYQAMQSLTFSRAKVCKGDEYDKALIDEAQKVRDRAKKMLQEMQSELFTRKPESFLRDLQEMKGHVQTVIHLLRLFSERFQQTKKDRGLVDFADLEHYCLQILNDGAVGEAITPSSVALNYRKQFREVFIDEYQDVNIVQESILQLVTLDEPYYGNLFMVGDVKQVRP